jgi:hypothetical protein
VPPPQLPVLPQLPEVHPLLRLVLPPRLVPEVLPVLLLLPEVQPLLRPVAPLRPDTLVKQSNYSRI